MRSRFERELFRRLRAQIDRATPAVAKQVRAALASLSRSLTVSDLTRLVAARDPFAIHDIASRLPLALRPALNTLATVFLAGAASGAALLPVRLAMRFDATNPYAAAAAKRSAGAFIAGVTDETRQAIRTIVSRSFTEGVTPRATAQLIRPLIGLTERQATAAATVYGDAIADGLSRTAARAQMETYASDLLTDRAMTIARTEIIKASTDGQIAAWMQAQRVGLLSRTAKSVWIVTEDDRLCPYCRRMDGQTIVVGATFNGARFGRVSGPPLHVNCRCTVGITFEVAA